MSVLIHSRCVCVCVCVAMVLVLVGMTFVCALGMQAKKEWVAGYLGKQCNQDSSGRPQSHLSMGVESGVARSGGQP